MHVKQVAIPLIMLIWHSGRALAGDDDGDGIGGPAPATFVFNAFGTAGEVHSSETHADFAGGVFSPNGAGYTHSWSNDVDSRLGGQITANASAVLSATVQVLSEQRYDNTYTPYVNWANVKYQPIPELSIRLGRTVLPSFVYSDTRSVGYTYPWVRPPVEIYSLVPVGNSDGVDVSYRISVKDVTQTFRSTLGGTRNTEPNGGVSDARHEWTISDSVEYRALTAHITYQKADLTIDSPGLNGLFDAFRSFGVPGSSIADRYAPHDKGLTFVSVGGIYDPSEGFIAAEWAKNKLNSVLGNSNAWYISGGYRFGALTPYVTYSRSDVKSNKSDPGLDTAGLSPPLAEFAGGLNGGLNAILGSQSEQRTISSGLRWDFAHNVEMKLQYDHTRNGAGSPGTLINLQPGFLPGGTVNLFSAVVEFVW